MQAEAETVLQQRKGKGGRGYVVLKAVVNQATQRAALLLADSSCLLVSLAERTAVVPITVPAPCSDACFLRLQAHGPAGASSSGHNSGIGVSPSPSKLGLGFGESHGFAPREKDSAWNGRLAKGQGRRELFVVTARPAQGGSCTDLRAWSIADDPAFATADIELDLGDNQRIRSGDELHNSSSSRAFARLDAPHGLAVKLAASINVLVVYSSSAGKFWVLAGKSVDRTGGPAQSNRKHLLLIKCAVVQCHGPVYSMHVSSLHLFLGESEGVRVWSLRPLIKPGHTKPRPEQGSHQSGNTLDSDRSQHVTESSRISEKTFNDNGADLDASVDMRNTTGVSALKKQPRKGLFSPGEIDVGASSSAAGNNQRKPELASSDYAGRISSGIFWTLSELKDVLTRDSTSENLSAEDDMVGKKTMESAGEGVTKAETRDDASSNCPPDHGSVPTEEIATASEPQGDIVTEASPSGECTENHLSKTTPRPRTGLTSVTESQPVSKKAIQQSGNRVQIRTRLDHPGMWFVALSDKEGDNTPQHAGPRPSSQLQVVDMQGLSLKEYVILDSKGGLHLLTLHEAFVEQKLVLPSPTLRHLQVTMHVTSFAVLPLPPPLPRGHRDFVSPAAATAGRKLWISDGMYSVYIVILPEEKTKGTVDSTQATLGVSQAVFMKDRVDGLVAASPDTVLVLMRGKLVSYVMP